MPTWMQVLLAVVGGVLLVWAALIVALWMTKPDELRLREAMRLLPDLVRLLTLQTGVSSLVEFTVPHDSHAIGLTVGSIDWPEDSTLVAILRDQAPITPSRDDVIDGGDELFFVTTIAAEAQLRELLSPGSSEGQEPAPGPEESQAQTESLEADGFEG